MRARLCANASTSTAPTLAGSLTGSLAAALTGALVGSVVALSIAILARSPTFRSGPDCAPSQGAIYRMVSPAVGLALPYAAGVNLAVAILAGYGSYAIIH